MVADNSTPGMHSSKRRYFLNMGLGVFSNFKGDQGASFSNCSLILFFCHFSHCVCLGQALENLVRG